MSRDPIDILRENIEEHWSRTGIQRTVFVCSERRDDGTPHVEATGIGYDIVITERGSEIERISGCSLREATWWYLFAMASGYAQKEELRMRRAPQDAPPTAHGVKDIGYSRWNWMAPTIEIMQRISPDFGARARADYEDVLRRYPLDDSEIRNARWPSLLE